ncbi:nuclear transport factor 2 family protein [Neotabrizicola sp. VNH66]|uniref:nuclear transport factor 2 family protein n=1 Tax=Neotabrizicola sp. VNH66 TaxID=3400918 RepID=UPI003C0F172A
MPDLSETIAGLEAARYDAMLRRDRAALDAMFDEDLVYTHSFGDRDSKQSYLDRLSAGFFDYIEIGHQIERILLREGCATVTGIMTARAIVGGEARSLHNSYTSVWTRTAAGHAWQMLAFQPTPIRKT